MPRATDIFFVGGGGMRSEQDEQTGDQAEGSRATKTNVLGVVFEDGRVDLCLEVEKMEGLWVGRQVSLALILAFIVAVLDFRLTLRFMS